MRIWKNRRSSSLVSSVALLTLASTGVQAQTWIPGGGGAWDLDANWTPTPYPNAIGASAQFNSPTSTRTVTFGSAITVGSLTMDNSGAIVQTIGQTGAPTLLTFDAAGAGPATLTLTGPAGGVSPGGATNANNIRQDIQVNDTLIMDVAP